MDLRSLSDEELMEHVQQGNRPAYETLFERHRGSVFGFLVRRTRERERASDLFQETWLRVHKGRHTYQAGQKFKPWLFGIALNASRDAGRKDTRRVDTVEMTMDRPARSIDHAQRMTLEQAIDTLPENLKDAFLLGAVHGLDHNEVAERLDISPANARARISRARKFLREKLT
jgi:RNA polymerase sigma-70 factor, ECF subfamily